MDAFIVIGVAAISSLVWYLIGYSRGLKDGARKYGDGLTRLYDELYDRKKAKK